MDQQAAYLIVLALAFFGWVAFGHKPGPGENVSLMRLCIGSGLIGLLSTLGVVAVSFLSGFTGHPELAIWLSLVIAAISGVALGMLALGRSHDAGKGRRFAAIGIIPLLGLWLMFAAPAPDPARPPYQPENKLLRFVIGFVALLIGSAVPQAIEFALISLPNNEEAFASQMEAEFAEINAGLPQRLDEYTVMERLDYDLSTKEIFYRNTVDLPADVVIDGIGDQIRENAVPEICGTAELKSLMDEGYSLVYTYETPTGETVPGFTVQISDCP